MLGGVEMRLTWRASVLERRIDLANIFFNGGQMRWCESQRQLQCGEGSWRGRYKVDGVLKGPRRKAVSSLGISSYRRLHPVIIMKSLRYIPYAGEPTIAFRTLQ